MRKFIQQYNGTTLVYSKAPTSLWEVWNTDFHGGGFVSRHKTQEAAIKASIKQKLKDCCCGCAYVRLAEHK